jgi:hypothetical protein
MKKMLLLCCSLSVMVALHAQIIHVPTDYPTIQHGINAANPGDTVLVADGTYDEQINFKGKKPLMVSSLFLMDGNMSHIDNTIIDKSTFTNLDSASLVYFVSGEDTTSVLCGFTIRHGKGTVYASPSNTYRAGGGVFISSSGAKIIHNHITYNHLSNALQGNTNIADGAGIGCEWNTGDHWVVVSDNVIDHNSCTSNDIGATGAGISINYNSRIIRNTISYNTLNSTANSYSYCAGFYCEPPTTSMNTVIAIVEYNIIKNNLSKALNNQAHTSGAGFASVKGIFSNNIVENNEVITNLTYGGGCAVLFWIPKEGSVVRNNIFRSNSSNNIGTLAVQTPETDPNPQTLLVENNYFLDNTGKSGAAFWADINPVILQNNVFSGNIASQNGGAVFYTTSSITANYKHLLMLINNSFYGNIANSFGGAICCNNTVKPLVINSIFWGDTAYSGSEIYLTQGDTLEIAYSNFSPSLVHGRLLDGGANITENPLFTDTVNLVPQSGSLVIDAGTASYFCHGETHHTPQYDILGISRPWGQAYDMGAYEYDFVGVHSGTISNTTIFPNPFNQSVTISYTTDKSGPVLLQVFDNYGRLVEQLVNSTQSAGSYNVIWHSENLPAGVYYCRLQAGKQSGTGKMILMR